MLFISSFLYIFKTFTIDNEEFIEDSARICEMDYDDDDLDDNLIATAPEIP